MKREIEDRSDCCGGCALFEDENVEGEGVCVFHQWIVVCGREACDDFILLPKPGFLGVKKRL
jgi:hypothetical protein